LRLQPSPDGLRGHLVHSPQAALPALPDAWLLPRLSVGRSMTAAWRGLGAILAAVGRCTACPTMRPYRKFPGAAAGRRAARFMLVGEAPGIASIENGRQWTGAGGMVLRREIRRLGLDLEDLFYLTNAVKCWPCAPGRKPANRSPLSSEAARCRPFLAREIAALDPSVVVAVGAVAARALAP